MRTSTRCNLTALARSCASRPHDLNVSNLQMGVKYAHFHKLPEASLDALKQAALK